MLEEIKRRYHLSQLKDDITKLNRSSETSQCLVGPVGTMIFLAGGSINERNPNLIGTSSVLGLPSMLSNPKNRTQVFSTLVEIIGQTEKKATRLIFHASDLRTNY